MAAALSVAQPINCYFVHCDVIHSCVPCVSDLIVQDTCKTAVGAVSTSIYTTICHDRKKCSELGIWFAENGRGIRDGSQDK